MDGETLQRLRNLVKSSITKEAHKTAQFWADKIVSVSDDPNDIYLLALCYSKTKQNARAYELLKKSHLIEKSQICRHLAATCLIGQEEWATCLEILTDQKGTSPTTSLAAAASGTSKVVEDPVAALDPSGIKIEALLSYLTGFVYHKLGNLEQAKIHLKVAVSTDVYCFEALEILLDYHLLTAEDERLFVIQNLDYKGQCGAEADLVKALYTTKLKKLGAVEHLNQSFEVLRDRFSLGSNSDVLTAHAEALFYQCRFQQSFQVTSSVIERDGNHQGCLLIHVSCLYELEMKNNLFILAHQLIDNYPDKALSWFAVGMYYFLIKKNAEARKHFIKATSLDTNFGPAWLGFGHSFAVDTETDPALSAYTTAARLLRGSHLPLLFIGMEHMKSNNPSVAEQYFEKALAIYKYDPLLLNEIGVMYYRANDFQKALRAFQDALELLEGNEFKKAVMKSAYLNLGHTYRKLKQYDFAITNYEKALSLDPYCSSSLSALGFVHHIRGNPSEAIEYYHQALALRPGDGFTSEMLSRALQEHFHKPLAQPHISRQVLVSKVASFIEASAAANEAQEEEEEEGGGGQEDDDDMIIE